MKLFFLSFGLEFFTVVMSLPQHRGFSQMHKDGGQVLSNHAKKIRSKLPLRRPLKQTKATLFPSSEQEQNKVLESMSPEYKYHDGDNTEKQNTHNQNKEISSMLDDKTIQDLVSKNLLDGESQQSTRGTPAVSIMKGPAGNRAGYQTMEQLNIILQNTLPEYKYDRTERGPGFSYDGCVDLDPDCWKYETHGLCSDSPDLAEKRFNCKKTCHLCVSSKGTRRHAKKGAEKQ